MAPAAPKAHSARSLVEGDAAALVEPHAEVEEAAGEGAEGPVWVSRPGRGSHAGRAGHRALVWLELGTIRSGHRGRRTRRPSQLESYERPQSVSTRALGGPAGTVFVDTYRRRRVQLR